MPSQAPWSRELEVAEVAARAAGRIQVERYERLEHIEFKSEKDVVTEVDHLSEEAIIETIRRSFPDDAFLAEESGASEHVADRVWVIDPLDGTVNYANGIPFFAVSIALVVDGRPVVGVVFDAMRDEMFTAASGRGANRNGQPIVHAGKERMVDSVVHLALPSNRFDARRTAIRRAVRITRSMGSSTLALTYVANGRFDAYVHWRGLSNWDIAAAGVIVAEAGARVTSASGGDWFDLATPTRMVGIVASAPAHHQAYLDMIGTADKG